MTYAHVRRGPPPGFAQARHFPYPAGTSGPERPERRSLRARRSSRPWRRRARLSRGTARPGLRRLPGLLGADPAGRDRVAPRRTRRRDEMVLWKLKKLLPGVTAELAVVFRDDAGVGEQKRVCSWRRRPPTLESIEARVRGGGRPGRRPRSREPRPLRGAVAVARRRAPRRLRACSTAVEALSCFSSRGARRRSSSGSARRRRPTRTTTGGPALALLLHGKAEGAGPRGGLRPRRVARRRVFRDRLPGRRRSRSPAACSGPTRASTSASPRGPSSSRPSRPCTGEAVMSATTRTSRAGRSATSGRSSSAPARRSSRPRSLVARANIRPLCRISSARWRGRRADPVSRGGGTGPRPDAAHARGGPEQLQGVGLAQESRASPDRRRSGASPGRRFLARLEATLPADVRRLAPGSPVRQAATIDLDSPSWASACPTSVVRTIAALVAETPPSRRSTCGPRRARSGRPGGTPSDLPDVYRYAAEARP